MNDYSVCPITREACLERLCAWWVTVSNKDGCAIRALAALIQQNTSTSAT